MGIRIIAGTFGGRIIKSPTGFVAHPMGDRVKSSLFNIISLKLNDAFVLDAFAGSGALGIEALSRGANHVVFLEKDYKVSQVLQENVALVDKDNKTRVYKTGVATWLDNNQNQKFDIIFADPPYDDMQVGAVKRLGELLKTGGMLILSHPNNFDLTKIDRLTLKEDRNYGNANIAIFVPCID